MRILNKKDALDLFLKRVYTYDNDLILTENEIYFLNEQYKNILEMDVSFEQCLLMYSDKLGLAKKLKSGLFEMQKQFNQRKALQPGILSECNFIETLAKIFELNKCLDCDNEPLNKVPLECREYINSGYQTYSAARYIYYNPKIKNIFLFQYGNPANGDAEIIIYGNKIRLEFKERVAKAGEFDITGLYDENGKLLISEQFAQKSPEFIPLIEKFNSETNVIEQIGHNYSDFDENTKIAAILEYFTKYNIDIIISSTNDNKLIAVTPECVKLELPDGRKIISTENSEIRTSGRNYRKIFTPYIFEKILNMLNAKKINDCEYSVLLENPLVELKKGKGTNTISRIKLNKIFFVKKSDAIINNGYVIFNINNVFQLIPSISMHITILASKEDLETILVKV